jgi:hypothetical protein
MNVKWDPDQDSNSEESRIMSDLKQAKYNATQFRIGS